MKKLSLLTALFLLFSFMGFAQEWHGITSDAPSQMKKTLISSTDNEIVVKVHVDGFYTSTVTTPNGKQVIVNVDRMPSMLEAGAPDLPMAPIPAIIGDKAEMTVSVVEANYVDIENIEVAPSKGNFSRQINPEDVPYTYGEMYQQDAFWPTTQAYLDAPYILRDFRGQNIMVRPFAYNPVTKTLRVYTDMTIAMTKVSDNGENQKVSRRSNNVTVDPEFKAAYQHRFINFGETEAKYSFIVDQGSMLVVCVDEYLDAIQPLVDWKNISGRPCTMVASSVTGTDDNLKTYILNYYNEHPDLTYILLVGEHGNLPGHYMSNYNGRSDIYYGMLEGSDLYAEALVGRFSPANYADAAQQAARTIYYERDVDETATWCNHGMGIGHTDGSGQGHFGEADYVHMGYIRDTLMHYTYTQVTERYVNVNTVSNEIISQDINDGIGIANYCNHGSATSWAATEYTTSHVNALVNDYKLPYVISVACNNGQFDVGECFGESWLRSVNESTGAPCGAIGGLFSWISQPWVPPMYGQDEINRIVTEWIGDYRHTMGGASINGSMYILDATSSSNDGQKTYATWILFGDPSVMLRTDNPTNMNVSHTPSVLMLGMDNLVINADAAYGIATLSMDGEIIATGNVVNGECTLTFPPLDNVGTAQLVVIGYNRVTHMEDIDIVPAEGAYVVVNSYESSAPANFGETVDMDIEIKNVGVEVASNLVATLSTECPYVEIINGEGAVASVDPDQMVTMEGFQFSVASNVPDGTVAQFFVDVTDGTDVWTSKINITLHAPVITLVNVVNVDNSALDVTFTNTGSAAFNGGVFNVYSCSPLLDFEFDTMEFYEIVEPGAAITVNAPYTFDASVEPGSTFEVAYEFISDMYMCDGDYVIAYGALKEDFEAGTFGDDWTLSQQYPWSIVEEGRDGKCAKSNNNGQNNSEGYMQLEVNVLSSGNVTFWYKVSSENNYDKLHFYMDGTQKSEWSGNVDWTMYTQPVTAGVHTFKWSYTKDNSVNSGQDCAWIDNIEFPPTNVVTFINPVTNLAANVEGMRVSLTWRASSDAESYLITRNGEAVTTIAMTEFSEVVEEGHYVYSVYAVHGDQASKPATVTVIVNYDDVIENQEVTMSVYPNPTNDVLNVVTDVENFEYQLINSVGQVVVSGNAEGHTQIRVNDMNTGVYILKVVANGDTKIQKVIIK